MSAQVERETIVPIAAIARHVGRSEKTISNDAKLGLIKLSKRRGVRGCWAPVAEVNRYIRKKYFGTPAMKAGDEDSNQ